MRKAVRAKGKREPRRAILQSISASLKGQRPGGGPGHSEGFSGSALPAGTVVPVVRPARAESKRLACITMAIGVGSVINLIKSLVRGRLRRGNARASRSPPKCSHIVLECGLRLSPASYKLRTNGAAPTNQTGPSARNVMRPTEQAHPLRRNACLDHEKGDNKIWNSISPAR